MNAAITGCSIFFRARSYRLDSLRNRWHQWVLGQGQHLEVGGRLVLLGDHTHVVKDGGRMPGVVSLRETSETQSKPSYFRGQCWGALGLLVGSWSACFCLPLALQLHQGFQHVRETATELRLGERVARMAVDFVGMNGCACWLVLDAFFASASVFRQTQAVWLVSGRQPGVRVITRAKKNYVAYCPPPARPPGQRGRNRQYGDKLVLWEAFDHPYLFRTVEVTLYGQQESVQLMSAHLLWRPLGQYLQFVWAITSRGPILLMCDDLTVEAEVVLGLYARRVRIETLFDTLKNTLGVFRFHFWSRHLPRHSRQPTSNRTLKPPHPQHLQAVRDCWRAMESFVLCASIAAGLLQLFSLKYADSLWQRQILYLRTRSRHLPSENTVRQILAPLLAREFLHSPPRSLWWKIRDAINGDEEDEHPALASVV